MPRPLRVIQTYCYLIRPRNVTEKTLESQGIVAHRLTIG